MKRLPARAPRRAGAAADLRAGACPGNAPCVDFETVRRFALSLPRTTEGIVRDRLKLRVGRLVYVAFSRDETLMGFAYPKEARAVLVRAEPVKYLLPRDGDLRYNWVVCRLGALGETEALDRVADAWTMVVPKFLAEQRFGIGPDPDGARGVEG